jgi:hypothetical protein
MFLRLLWSKERSLLFDIGQGYSEHDEEKLVFSQQHKEKQSPDDIVHYSVQLQLSCLHLDPIAANIAAKSNSQT